MTKKLINTTIVPQSQYIERDADRQIKEIISNMGRPGYVLVSRQMGKTNLLLNAKRNLTNKNTIFVYLDLSNKFGDLRSFFRNIIDTTLETTEEFSKSKIEEIKISRTANTDEPHIEHDKELRLLLTSIPDHKLVICLDEIDSLAGSHFSDEVFSFIRSVYFSGRSNFPRTYNRLTYILSGVAEPADIIKNKDISPFNIGQKIYLNDFNKSEATTFIENNIPSLSNETKERIHYWSNGNPRILWDICSHAEDIRENIKSQDVDQIVNKLYFSDLDTPPIDHIKQLVENNQELRDAVISIHYKKTDSLSDSIKTKLFLSGIINYNKKDNVINFKNKVIEESISEDFLLTLTPLEKNLSIAECEALVLSKQDYYTAVQPLIFIHANGNISKIDRESCCFLLATCFFNTESPKDALHYIDQILDVDDSSFRKDALFLKSLALAFTGNYKNSKIYLNALTSEERDKTTPYYIFSKALICIIDSKIKGAYHESANDYEDVISAINFLSSKKYFKFIENDLILYILISNYAHLKNFDLHLITKNLNKFTSKKYLFLSQLKLISKDIILFTINDINDYIKNEQKIISGETIITKGITSKDLASTLRFLKKNNESDYKELIGTVTSNLSDEEIDEIFISCVKTNINDRNREIGLDIILHHPNYLSKEYGDNFRGCVAFLTIIEPIFCTEKISCLIEEVQLNTENILPIEYKAFYTLATNHKKVDLPNSIAKIFKNINSNQISAAEDTPEIIKKYIYIKLQILSNKAEEISDFAYVTNISLNKINEITSSFFQNENLNFIKLDLVQSMIRSKIFTQTRKTRKYGRNEIVKIEYPDGIISGKYKDYINDINNGKCKILE